ncbi:hypothetical protein [Candidatus Nitrosotenuis cloacae]|uniref:hypothetical protein n=1 Tax=Candidatus Nitrosotenuis cloacae TaxID=1603555 RepID=UPI0011DCBAAD|nr:hypothetical protein [Candidatus Nitrosotenuis cloacae]
MRFLLILLVAALALIVPSVSYSDTGFVLAGNGYGKTSNGVQTTSLQALLDFSDSEIMFQSGRLLIGDDTHTITDMTISLSNNKKSLKLTATSDDLGITASGKLILSAGANSIYHIQGKTSDSESFSIFAILKQDKKLVIETQKPTQKDILLLVKQTERVEWKSPYKFTIRTFDPKLNTLSDFHSTSGYLEGITISTIITNPIGDKIKTSEGMTQKFGYYEDSVIIPDNARTGIYTLNVTASDKDYKTVSKEFTFVVFPISTGPTATP